MYPGCPTLPRVLKGSLSDYEWALASAPELGQVFLRDWLETTHKDIISGWDFEGEVPNCRDLTLLRLMLMRLQLGS